MKRDIAQPEARATLTPRVDRPARAWLAARIGAINWPLLLIVLLGVALRLWMIRVSPFEPRFSNADDGDYYQRALRFALTGQYIDDSWLIRPPLHVLFFAFWLRVAIVAGQPQLGLPLIQLAQTALGAITILLGYGIAGRLFRSARAGLLFAAFLACWFPFVEQPSLLFSELLYICLFLLHVWLLLRFDAGGRRRDLAGSGFALGAAALTRSPALYSLAFVALWLLVRAWTRASARAIGARWRAAIGQALLVALCCVAVVAPWTIRNALVYRRFIPIDTLGPINLWLDLDSVNKRNQHIDDLRQLPQADRQAYATERVRAILAADPLRPFRGMWPTFRHIWKAQYVEDLYVKQSFFGRPLRAAAPLGLAGDALWLIYTLAGVVGLAAPPREGAHNRLFVLAWLGYSLMTVLVFHVEPRYLLPIWLLIALYGAGTLARGRETLADLRARPRYGAVAAALVVAFLALFLTYRDYPAIIADGLARERAISAGERAYAGGDYAAAERDFRAGLAVQPEFVDGQADLALALAAQGRRADAAAAVAGGGSREADFVSGVLRLDTPDADAARALLARTEATAGEDMQRWARTWLRPPPAAQITLGDGRDLGYIEGFSGPETGPAGPFRWLEGDGRITLTPPDPLRPGAALALRMAGGRPGATPLDVHVGDGPPVRLLVQGGQWREYRLPLPPAWSSARPLEIELSAPTFSPAQTDPASADLRTLSLMVGAAAIR